jgi:hypothetical protein
MVEEREKGRPGTEKRTKLTNCLIFGKMTRCHSITSVTLEYLYNDVIGRLVIAHSHMQLRRQCRPRQVQKHDLVNWLNIGVFSMFKRFLGYFFCYMKA